MKKKRWPAAVLGSIAGLITGMALHNYPVIAIAVIITVQSIIIGKLYCWWRDRSK